MQINGINNIFNINNYRNRLNRENSYNTNPFAVGNFNKSHTLSCDVVSFKSKEYSINDILNPTNHCAYCGCKVYSEAQIESIAKQMLSSKYRDLEGKIKSVLEKLEGAKHSPELALAKNTENASQIQFFNNLLQVSSKKSYMKTDAIFKEVYGMDEKKALETIVDNLQPLLRTVDHISPQNQEMDNMHSDINLVETCYCCNHDVKDGVPFEEFYIMFPGINKNMPAEKFEYAKVNLLDSSKENVQTRLSAVNMLKHLDRLFIQRTEVANNLDTIDFTIKGCKNDILALIESSKSEIEDKKTQILDLNKQLDELKLNDHYQYIVKRIELVSNISNVNSIIENINSKIAKASNQINTIRNEGSADKKAKKCKNKSKQQEVEKNELTPEQIKERDEKIDALKAQIESLKQQKAHLEDEVMNYTIQIEDIDKKYPTVEMLQSEKTRLDTILNAINGIINEQHLIVDLNNQVEVVEQEEKSLSDKISLLPEKDFSLDDYSEEEQSVYNRYNELVDALDYIDEHQNLGPVKTVINNAARDVIINEINELAKMPIVVAYNNDLQKKDLKTQLNKVLKDKNNLLSQIQNANNKIVTLNKTAQNNDKEHIINQILYISNTIKETNELICHTRIPNKIKILENEILLLEQTIKDLEENEAKINSKYQVST